ncbi:MAG: hypothetical protein U0R72_19520 [Nakamurella multipartita]
MPWAWRAAGVLCWSGGGPSSYRLAARHPDRVRALVSVAAVSHRYHFDGEKGAEKVLMGTGLGRRMLQLMAAHTRRNWSRPPSPPRGT